MRILTYFLGLSLFSLAQAEPLKVAVTHPFYGDWAKQIGGDLVEVVVVTETDSSGLKDAAIVYETGLEQEPWLEDAIQKSGAEPRRVVLSRGMPTMAKGFPYWEAMPLPHPNPEKMPECCQKDASDTNAAWQDLVDKMPVVVETQPTEVDPNLWYNPMNAQSAVLVISDTLVEALPDSTETFDINVGTSLTQLAELDGWIKSRLRNVPPGNRVLVTDGDSFRYFAREYGYFAPMHDRVKEPIEFHEVEVIEGTSADVLATTLSKADKLETYDALMRRNVEVIEKALASQPAG